MFVENKYYKIYNQIIDNRKNNPVTGYTETHHIIPKSLGGTNDPKNLVALTAREHYICHYLLTKFTTGQDYYNMAYAFNLMNFDNSSLNRNNNRQINSILYENNRIKISEFMKGHDVPEETRNKISESLMGRFKGENSPNWGKKLTPEIREKISKSKKGQSAGKNNPMYGVHRYGKENPMYGKKHTPEALEKMSKSRKGKKQPVLECPHCGKIGGRSNMKRYHFDNCKFRED